MSYWKKYRTVSKERLVATSSSESNDNDMHNNEQPNNENLPIEPCANIDNGYGKLVLN